MNDCRLAGRGLLGLLGLITWCGADPAAAGDVRSRALNPVTWCDTPAVAPVVLVKDGVPAATVVVPETDIPFDKAAAVPYPGAARVAADEFVAHVKLATGAALTIVTDTQRDKLQGTLVLIGESDLTREKGIRTADLEEGFRVQTFEGGLAIVGKVPDELRHYERMKTGLAQRRPRQGIDGQTPSRRMSCGRTS